MWFLQSKITVGLQNGVSIHLIETKNNWRSFNNCRFSLITRGKKYYWPSREICLVSSINIEILMKIFKWFSFSKIFPYNQKSIVLGVFIEITKCNYFLCSRKNPSAYFLCLAIVLQVKFIFPFLFLLPLFPLKCSCSYPHKFIPFASFVLFRYLCFWMYHNINKCMYI